MRKVMLFLVAGLVFFGSVAYATIPDSSGVIHGCYKTSNPGKGALAVVDSDVESCPSGFTSLDWNQTGPTGPMGPAGSTGATGPAGPPGPIPTYDRQFAEFTVPSGDFGVSPNCNNPPNTTAVAVDVGYKIEEANPQGEVHIWLVAVSPGPNPGGGSVNGTNQDTGPGSVKIQIYLLCAIYPSS